WCGLGFGGAHTKAGDGLVAVLDVVGPVNHALLAHPLAGVVAQDLEEGPGVGLVENHWFDLARDQDGLGFGPVVSVVEFLLFHAGDGDQDGAVNVLGFEEAAGEQVVVVHGWMLIGGWVCSSASRCSAIACMHWVS